MKRIVKLTKNIFDRESIINKRKERNFATYLRTSINESDYFVILYFIEFTPLDGEWKFHVLENREAKIKKKREQLMKSH